MSRFSELLDDFFYRPDEDVAFGPAEWVLEGVTCEDRPVCALVIVPYAAVGWGP